MCGAQGDVRFVPIADIGSAMASDWLRLQVLSFLSYSIIALSSACTFRISASTISASATPAASAASRLSGFGSKVPSALKRFIAAKNSALRSSSGFTTGQTPAFVAAVRPRAIGIGSRLRNKPQRFASAICILVARSQTAALLGSRAVRRERFVACASEASNITSPPSSAGRYGASSLNIDRSTLVNDDGGRSRATRAASSGTTLRLAALLRGTFMTSIYLDGIVTNALVFAQP